MASFFSIVNLNGMDPIIKFWLGDVYMKEEGQALQDKQELIDSIVADWQVVHLKR